MGMSRSTSAGVPVAGAIVFGVVVTAFATTASAQNRVASLAELRRQLAIGDVVAVTPPDGPPIAGRLKRLGDRDLILRPVGRRSSQTPSAGDLTIPLDAITSLERLPDSTRDGAWRGAAVGLGLGAGMFGYAFAVDRNEMDEWAPAYLGATAIFTGLGALFGWRIDAAHSKPSVRFEAYSPGRMQPETPLRSHRGVGIAVRASF
jgi:hypothetical protein